MTESDPKGSEVQGMLLSSGLPPTAPTAAAVQTQMGRGKVALPHTFMSIARFWGFVLGLVFVWLGGFFYYLQTVY